MAARLSALCASRTLPPGFFIIFKDSWYSFLLEAESTPGPVWPEGLGQFKKIHLIGTYQAYTYKVIFQLKYFTLPEVTKLCTLLFNYSINQCIC
jgi:hypothetical protein